MKRVWKLIFAILFSVSLSNVMFARGSGLGIKGRVHKEYNPFSELLRSVGLTNGITRKQVAARVGGVTDSTIRSWVYAERLPYLATLYEVKQPLVDALRRQGVKEVNKLSIELETTLVQSWNSRTLSRFMAKVEELGIETEDLQNFLLAPHEMDDEKRISVHNSLKSHAKRIERLKSAIDTSNAELQFSDAKTGFLIYALSVQNKIQNNEFAAIIRDATKNPLKLATEDLAERLGLTTETVQNWKQGTSLPNLRNVHKAKIKDLLGLEFIPEINPAVIRLAKEIDHELNNLLYILLQSWNERTSFNIVVKMIESNITKKDLQEYELVEEKKEDDEIYKFPKYYVGSVWSLYKAVGYYKAELTLPDRELQNSIEIAVKKSHVEEELKARIEEGKNSSS